MQMARYIIPTLENNRGTRCGYGVWYRHVQDPQVTMDSSAQERHGERTKQAVS